MAEWSKEIFAKNLRKYMEEEDLTQKEVADIAKVSAPTVNDWLKSKKYPRIDKIERLASYFSILKSDLIEEKTEEHKEIQKNNDIIADIVVRLRTDSDFLSVVENLNNLNEEQLRSVKQMLSAFIK